MNPLETENRGLKRTLHVMISKAERNRDILHTFQDIELRLLSCDSLADLLDMLLITLREYFRLDVVQLVLFDPEHTARDLIPNYTPPDTPNCLQFSENYRQLRELYPRQPKPRLGSHDDAITMAAFGAGSRIKSSAILPLVRQNVIIGSLHLGSYDPSRYNPNVAVDYISHLASVIAVCIENCINHETLRWLSMVDVLTKVHNRRAFNAELNKEMSRACRNQQPLSCLFIDLDHFKAINDKYGHQTGDRVLRGAAQTIKDQLRKTDFIARYGGEEFAVLLPGCHSTQALQVAETIRVAVSQQQFIDDNQQPFGLTLSIGVCCCPAQEIEPTVLTDMADLLVASADKGVYQAKALGRNQVCYSSLDEQPTTQAMPDAEQVTAQF
ncbi:MAG: sensor domain-containing diguanylate cyclase [Motiliproteus sp.]